MKAKKGKRIEPVKPPAPEQVLDADEASPGKIAETKAAQQSKGAGKYGKTKLPAHKPASGSSGKGSVSSTSSSGGQSGSAPASGSTSGSDKGKTSEEDKKNAWVGIFLTDEEGNAVVGQKYEVILPDGTLSKGTTGQDGKAKIEGFEPGTCKVSFPELVSGSVSKK